MYPHPMSAPSISASDLSCFERDCTNSGKYVAQVPATGASGPYEWVQGSITPQPQHIILAACTKAHAKVADREWPPAL